MVVRSHSSLSRGQGRAKNTVETCGSSQGMETEGSSGKRRLSNTVQHSKGKRTRGSGTKDLMNTIEGHSGISQLQWYEDPECPKVKLEPSDDLVSLVRSLYVHARDGARKKLCKLNSCDYQGFEKFWLEECCNIWLCRGEGYAMDCDYGKVREWIDDWAASTSTEFVI